MQGKTWRATPGRRGIKILLCVSCYEIADIQGGSTDCTCRDRGEAGVRLTCGTEKNASGSCLLLRSRGGGFLQRAEIITITGKSYRLKNRACTKTAKKG